MSTFLFDKLYTGLNNVLDLRSKQHALSAGNIANADTPGYKAKFIPFDKVLGDALHGNESVGMQRTSAMHIQGSGTVSNPKIEETEAPEWAEDGNSVVAEREMARLTGNSLLYGAVVRGVSQRLAILRYAASNGKG
jgi:flagellar basal-body rod protein FlgB